MNENQNTEIQTPHFENEEMKMPENMIPLPVETKSDNVITGPLLIVLATLLVLILGGMYYWFITISSQTEPLPTPTTERPTAEQNNEPESTTAEAQTKTIETTSPSDEIIAIEADLESTDFENLDAELNTIDAELEAALR